MANNSSKSGNIFLFKYDVSIDTLKQMIQENTMQYLLANATPEGSVEANANTLVEKFKNRLDQKKNYLWKWILYLFTGENENNKLSEPEIEAVINETGFSQAAKQDIYRLITKEPPTTSAPRIEKVTVLFNYFIFFIILSLVIYFSRFSKLISVHIAEMHQIPAPSQPIVILGLVFQIVGLIAFISAFVLIWVRNMQFKVNNVSERNKRFREKFLLTIPNQIMNLGLITMIFAVIGVIFFKEKHLVDIVDYVNLTFGKLFNFSIRQWGLNLLQVLLVFGGLTEAAAFYLGYRFPEKLKTDEDEDIAQELKISKQGVSGSVSQPTWDAAQAEMISAAVSQSVYKGIADALSKLNSKISAGDNS